MAKTYNRLEIDVNKKPNSIGIRPVQHDTKSRYLDVCLYENGVPINLTGEQVRITFRKVDGSTFFNQGEVTDAAAGRCQFALTNEILSEAKAVEAQISVWNAGGQILSTQVFEIYVTAAIPWTDAVESENEYGVLVVLFQEIQDALDTMHKIAATFGEPGDKAAEYGVDTFWGILETLAGRGDVESALEKKIKTAINSTLNTQYFKSLDQMLSSKAGTAAFQPLDKYIHGLLTTETTVAKICKEDITKVVLKSDSTGSSSYGTIFDVVNFVVEQPGEYLFFIGGTSNGNGVLKFYVDDSEIAISGIKSHVLTKLEKGQKVKIQGQNQYNNRRYELGPVYYYTFQGSYIGTTSGIETVVTPKHSGSMMLLFPSKVNSVTIGDKPVNIRCDGYDGENGLYIAEINVIAGVSMTIKCPGSSGFCIAAIRYQTELVSSFIKSIQRGRYYGSISAGDSVFAIPIGTVNPTRTYIDLPGYIADGVTIIDAEIVGNDLLVSCYAASGGSKSFRWQLVEFS